jgi:murein DD-endopeptidase MepM/ murein hydrolase activator NlpD
MSQWTASRSQQTARAQAATLHPAHHHAHSPQPSRDGGRRSEPRLRGREAANTGYMIAHAGRQVRFGPVVFWIAVGTVVIMAGWSVAAATYLAFRDDVLRTLIAHQADQQFAYEDRIAELRAQIDRTTSRQLLDQEQVEQKLEDLMHRQAILEQHATALGGASDPATTGSIKPAARPPDPAPSRGSGKQSSLSVTLGKLEASLDRVERRQSLAVAQIDDRYESKARLIRGVLTQLGVKINGAPAATGGPFVPIKLPSENESFERAVMRANLARTDASRLSNVLANVPVRKPVTGEIDETSPFGVRMDPFVHEAAMHTGIDFRGEIGEPIHVTAAGTVSIAGWTGGYGKMVEVDHGNGLATRYGHLSEIDVSVGDQVRIGQVIGKLGSTGRSTGPHIHYETRVDGEPVNPQKFLDAGDKLFGG